MPGVFGGGGGAGTPPTVPTGGGGGSTLGTILPGIIGILGGLGTGALASGDTRKAKKLAKRQAEQGLAIQRQIFDMIMPFATQLLQLGLNPADILKTPLGASLLSPGRQAITGEFEQSRQNLVDLISGTGFSPASGVAQGPLANMFSQEALAQSNLVNQLPQTALGLGMQGANILGGQQAVFNPSGAIGQFGALAQGGSPFQSALTNLPAAISGIIDEINRRRRGTTPTSTGGGTSTPTGGIAGG